jgi:hypothetical protein
MLRNLGARALEDEGFVVEKIAKSGVAPGSLLRVRKGSNDHVVAVRTCPLRKLQGVRNANGSWRTLSIVDEVVAVAPDLPNPSTVEVFGFDAKVVVEAFESAFAATEKAREPGEPIFLSLDERYSRADESAQKTRVPGLKSKALWTKVLPISRAEEARPHPAPRLGLLEHLRREAATYNNVDVNQVTVEVHFREHEPMTEGDHDLLDRYLSTILSRFKSDKINRKTASLDIAEAIARLHNEGVGSMKSYLRATLRGEEEDR